MKYEINLQYIMPNNKQVIFRAENLTGKEALQTTDKLIKSGYFKAVQFFDQFGTEWSRKELAKILETKKVEPS